MNATSQYQSLLQQKAELEAQIAQVHAREKADAVAHARTLITEYGLTAADVFPPAKAKGISVGVAKYRDPATGATWTGRGKPPNWIKDVADRTPFEIKPA